MLILFTSVPPQNLVCDRLVDDQTKRQTLVIGGSGRPVEVEAALAMLGWCTFTPVIQEPNLLTNPTLFVIFKPGHRSVRTLPRSDALYLAHSEKPRNKNVMATVEKGLTDVRVFSGKMPRDVVVPLGFELMTPSRTTVQQLLHYVGTQTHAVSRS